MLKIKTDALPVADLVRSIGNTPLVDISSLSGRSDIRLLAKLVGSNTGIGIAVAGALILAQELRHVIIVVVLPDRGDRYLSTNLFRSHCAECPP